jgi:hypothetical protein
MVRLSALKKALGLACIIGWSSNHSPKRSIRVRPYQSRGEMHKPLWLFPANHIPIGVFEDNVRAKAACAVS